MANAIKVNANVTSDGRAINAINSHVMTDVPSTDNVATVLAYVLEDGMANTVLFVSL